MKSPASDLKGLLFDLDDTLYAYKPCNETAKKAAWEFLSRRLSLSTTDIARQYDSARQAVHKALLGQAASHSRLLYLQKLIEQVKGTTDFSLTLAVEKIFWHTYLETMVLRPGVIEMLKAAKKKGLKVAIVSDLTAQIQYKKINRLKIGRYIDYLVTSEEVGREKPSPLGLRVALKKLNLKPKNVVFIGDSEERDRAVAMRAGVRFVKLSADADVTMVRNLF